MKKITELLLGTVEARDKWYIIGKYGDDELFTIEVRKGQTFKEFVDDLFELISRLTSEEIEKMDTDFLSGSLIQRVALLNHPETWVIIIVAPNTALVHHQFVVWKNDDLYKFTNTLLSCINEINESTIYEQW